MLATYCEELAADVVGSEEPDQVETRHVRKWVIDWDGSFDGSKAGLGITLAIDNSIILKASVPVYATDATRCEALGPALAALFLERL